MMHGPSIIEPYFIDENRVQIEDLPSLDFLLHIFVHHSELPRYMDLLREIQCHSKVISSVSPFILQANLLRRS